MTSSPDPLELKILRSWHTNAEPWSEAIDSGSIVSRRLVTDRAVVTALLQLGPKRVLDIGCGEGWLARTLVERGVAVVGVDAVAALVARAGQNCAQAAAHSGRAGTEFHVLDYARLANHELVCEPCSAAVCNFSLLGNESVEAMLTALPGYLHSDGHLIIQTLHPVTACGDAPYQDGWREGSWQGFGPGFTDPAPWYFRTLQSWQAMLLRCGFAVQEMREPVFPDTHTPASVLFICKMPGAMR